MLNFFCKWYKHRTLFQKQHPSAPSKARSITPTIKNQTVKQVVQNTYHARDHFPLLGKGEVPYHKDNRNDALPIESRQSDPTQIPNLFFLK